MNAGTRIIHGFTQQYFHTLPGELDQVTVSPERSAIFGYMANIGWKRFPEFISDILVMVDGHRLIDITDGPGDEKQDILTETSDGKRCLTQTKHVMAADTKASGDDLDLLLPACLRKDCAYGLYVTNSDLTIQAKRYVNDREYARGWKGAADEFPQIDYWTGAKIWERISTNSTILNKWFSGMGQAHALRRFYFDLLVQKLPQGEVCDYSSKTLAEWLSERCSIQDLGDGLRFEVQFGDQVRVTISRSFRSALDLDLHYVGPHMDDALYRAPLSTFRLDVQVADEVGQFDPAKYRDEVVDTIARLPQFETTGPEWWHFTATTPSVLLFLQDVNEPKVVSVSQAAAYVRTENTLGRERLWYRAQSDELPRKGESENDLVWEDEKSQTRIMLLATQRADPVVAYDLHVRQLRVKAALASYSLRRIPNADEDTVEMVRRLAQPNWYVMISAHRELIWAISPDGSEKHTRSVDETVEEIGWKVEVLTDDEKKVVIETIEDFPAEPPVMWVCDEQSLSTPLWIPKRILYFSRESELASPITRRVLEGLIDFKIAYEKKYGYDFFDGKPSKRLAVGEVRRFLYDPLTVRGSRMLDVVIVKNTLRVDARYREGRMDPLDALIGNYLTEFGKLHDDVLSKTAGPAPTSTSSPRHSDRAD